jgi:hypothetical protein
MLATLEIDAITWSRDTACENIDKRNLLIVDLKPFYDSALAGDLKPFEKFEVQLLQELKKMTRITKVCIDSCRLC